MKRKYAAIVLGMALTFSSISVFAEEAATEVAAEATDETTEGSDIEASEGSSSYTGIVTDVTEAGVTVSIGYMGRDLGSEAGPEAADEEGAENSDEAADDGTAENSDEAADDGTAENSDEAVDSDAAENSDESADGTPAEEGVAPGENADFLNESTLIVSGEEMTLAFADDISAVQLSELKSIAVLDSADMEIPEQTGEAGATLEEGTDLTEEIPEVPEDLPEDAEAPDGIGAEEETIDLDVTTLQEGDVITFTLDEDGSIETLTLLGTESIGGDDAAADIELVEVETEADTAENTAE